MSRIATLTLNPALDVTTATEQVRPTHKLRCATPRFDPGGGGINVARVIHRLGGAVTAVFPSGGPAGALIERLLKEAGVPIAPVAIAGATRESFTVDETASGLQYRFVLPGPELSHQEQARVLEAIEALPEPHGFVVASGSLPPGCDPEILARLNRATIARGARLVVDTSGPALAACEGAMVYLIKPSLRELGELIGRALTSDEDAIAAAAELRARRFAEVVVVSLGERGALLAAEGISERFGAIEVPVVSAVGAGDAMVAAITLSLANGASLHEALRHGTAAGAAALLSPGTELARPEDVATLLARAPA